MRNGIVGVILFFFVITLSTVAHEFGHYFAARHYGVIATQFNIGFGKKLFGFSKGGTQWNVRLLPVGGSNYFDDKQEKKMKALGPWQRIVIDIAGPVFNFIAAFVLWFLALLCVRKVTPYNLFYEYYNAAKTIVTLIPSSIEASLHPTFDTTIYGFSSSMVQDLAEKTPGMRMMTAFCFTEIINLALGLTNLLPIPGLDGGQALFALLEIVKYPVPAKAAAALERFCVLFLISLSVAYFAMDASVALIGGI